jgi:hypothetical protein
LLVNLIDDNTDGCMFFAEVSDHLETTNSCT